MRKITHKQIAWMFFYPAGKGYSMVTIDPITGKEIYWVLHHVDINLKNNDPKRYAEWRIEDLVMITTSIHNKIHHKGKVISAKTKKLMSNASKGSENSFFGKHHTEEIKKSISEKLTGRKLSAKTKELLVEQKTGRFWWINKITKEIKFQKECPGNEWVKGRKYECISQGD